MSDTSQRARDLLALRRALHREALKIQARQRTGHRRSAQQRRRRRLAEEAAAAIHGTLPASIDLSRRRLARLLLEASTLPSLLSTRETADLEALLTTRIRTGGQRGRASYWSDLGDPPICEPGETTAARLFYRRILSVLDQGGWTGSERAALCVLAKRWLARAEGRDGRFMEVGTVGAGRLPRDVERRIKARGTS